MKRLRRLVSSLVLCCFLLCSCLSLNVSAFDYQVGEQFSMPDGFNMPDCEAVVDMVYSDGARFRFCITKGSENFKVDNYTNSGIVPNTFVIHYLGSCSYLRYWISADGSNGAPVNYDISSSGYSGSYNKIHKIIVSNNNLLDGGSLDTTYTSVYLAPTPQNDGGILNSLKEWFTKLWEWLSSILESIKEIPIKIVNALINLKDEIVTWFSDLFDWLDWLFQYAIDEVSSFFTDLKNSIKGFFIKLVDDIKGLFVPDEAFWQEYQNKWLTWFQEHLGAVFQLFSFAQSTIYSLSTYSPDSTPSITLPAIDLPLPDRTVHLMEEHIYTFDILNTSPWSTLYGFYKTMVWVFAFMALYKLIQDTYERITNK